MASSESTSSAAQLGAVWADRPGRSRQRDYQAPDQGDHPRGAGQIGTNDLFQGAFDLSGAVDPAGEFMFRLTGLARDSDAQTAHFADFIKDDRLFIAPAFTWRPDDDTTFTVFTDFQRDDSGNAFLLEFLSHPVTTFRISTLRRRFSPATRLRQVRAGAVSARLPIRAPIQRRFNVRQDFAMAMSTSTIAISWPTCFHRRFTT